MRERRMRAIGFVLIGVGVLAALWFLVGVDMQARDEEARAMRDIEGKDYFVMTIDVVADDSGGGALFSEAEALGSLGLLAAGVGAVLVHRSTRTAVAR